MADPWSDSATMTGDPWSDAQPSSQDRAEGTGNPITNFWEDWKARSKAVSDEIAAAGKGLAPLLTPQRPGQSTGSGLGGALDWEGGVVKNLIQGAGGVVGGMLAPVAAAGNMLSRPAAMVAGAAGVDVDPNAITDVGLMAVPLAGELNAARNVAKAAEAAGLSVTAYQRAAALGRAARATEAARVATAPKAVAPAPIEAVEEGAAPASAVDRVAQARSEGVDLSRAQATQDFTAQNEENTLRNAPTAEGEQARQFGIQQQQQIQDAVGRFRGAFGDPEATAETRGQVVKDSIRQLRDAGKEGVDALYQSGRDLLANVGDNAKALLDLDTTPLLAKMREIQVDRVIPQGVRDALRDEMARYGLIGEPAKTTEGISSVKLLDDEGKTAETIRFAGPQERLNVTNAEDLRKTVNDLFAQDPSRRSQGIKPILDDAVSAAIERAATEGMGEGAAAIKAGRAAHAEQKATFASGDVVSNIIAWKKGTRDLDAMKPEDVIKNVYGAGPDAITNLRRVKAVLLNKPTPASKGAWEAIRAHGIGQIFDKAMVLNSNPGSGMLGTISGSKLNTAIRAFGIEKLKAVLEPEEFAQLMKLRRIIGDATIPVNGTTNPSGTAAKVIEFLNRNAARLGAVARHVPVVGPVADMVGGVGHLARIGREAGAARATLKGMTQFEPQATPAPRAIPPPTARQYIEISRSPAMLAPFLAGGAIQGVSSSSPKGADSSALPDLPPPVGLKAPGNLDPWHRPILHNADGSYSTTSSISIGTDAGEVLIPTVIDGKRLSNAVAIEHFRQTGENFGTFDTPAHADAYATELHNRQDAFVQRSGQLRQR